MNQSKKMIGLGLIGFLFFVFDRVLKFLFSANSREFFVFGDWFKLGLAFNPGLVFGLPANFYLIIFLCCLILLFLIWFGIKLWKEKKTFLFFFVVLIICGAVSNLLDRLYLGYVIDYFDLKYYSVFNLADLMIVAGVLGFFFREVFRKRKS